MPKIIPLNSTLTTQIERWKEHYEEPVASAATPAAQTGPIAMAQSKLIELLKPDFSLFKSAINPSFMSEAQIAASIINPTTIIFFQDPIDEVKKFYYLKGKHIVACPTDTINLALLNPLTAKFDAMADDSWCTATNDELKLIQVMMNKVWAPKKEQKKLKVASESMRVDILNEIYKSLMNELIIKPPPKPEKKPGKKFMYWALAVAGAIVFGSEGFDGINSIFNLFELPARITMIVGSIFAFLSVLVYWGYGLIQIAENINVDTKNTRGIVDDYIEQLDEIEKITDTMELLFNEKDNINRELDEYPILLHMLRNRLRYLNHEKAALDRARGSKKVGLAKDLAGFVAGVIFFSSGFFTGQAVALGIAALFVTSASFSFPPILAASLLVGVIAFFVYWYSDKLGIENLVGRIFGLDNGKLHQLDEARVEKISSKISTLDSKLENCTEIKTLRNENHLLTTKLEESKKRVTELEGLLAKSPSERGQEADAALVLERQQTKEQLTEKDRQLAEKDAELALLKQQVEQGGFTIVGSPQSAASDWVRRSQDPARPVSVTDFGMFSPGVSQDAFQNGAFSVATPTTNPSEVFSQASNA